MITCPSAVFRRYTIDERAERRRGRDTRETGDAHRNASAGRIEAPLLEKDAQERAETLSCACQRKIERVKSET